MHSQSVHIGVESRSSPTTLRFNNVVLHSLGERGLCGTTVSFSFVSSESLCQLYIFIVVAMCIACVFTQRSETLNNIQYIYGLIQSRFLLQIMFYLASAITAA
jgi:hypothetical protein